MGIGIRKYNPALRNIQNVTNGGWCVPIKIAYASKGLEAVITFT